jgi:hypothetical protein
LQLGTDGHENTDILDRPMACVQQQSTSALWRLQEKLFEKQDILTAGNVGRTMQDLVTKDPVLKVSVYKDCVSIKCTAQSRRP